MHADKTAKLKWNLKPSDLISGYKIKERKRSGLTAAA